MKPIVSALLVLLVCAASAEAVEPSENAGKRGYRLARFNLSSDEHQKASHTLGVPTPIAAGYMMALVLMRDHIPVPAAATAATNSEP